MDNKDPAVRAYQLRATDYSELTLLLKGAQQALLSGELNDWQHATTSTFHLMAQFILDLHERVIAFGQSSDNRLARAYPSTDQPILTTTDLENGRDL